VKDNFQEANEGVMPLNIQVFLSFHIATMKPSTKKGNSKASLLHYHLKNTSLNIPNEPNAEPTSDTR
jgi:hypothetical protein